MRKPGVLLTQRPAWKALETHHARLRDVHLHTLFTGDGTGRGWLSPEHHGLDQGPVALMIENHRSGLLWRLMRECPAIVTGLRRAGFRNGWLR